jgi:hypothetical protein
MDDYFGARAARADVSAEPAVDWPKVIVWVAMAAVGVGLWGFAGVALVEALSRL